MRVGASGAAGPLPSGGRSMRQKCVVVSLLAVAALGVLLAPQAVSAATRTYFIAAERSNWDFAPTGRNVMHGGPIPDPWAGNTVWSKVRYIEYTDGRFTTRKPQPNWLGVLGPIIRAEVG